MGAVMDMLGRRANAVHVSLYRRSHGRRFDRAKGMPVALVTVRGRRTGTPYTTPVVYLDVDEGTWVVAGSNGGAKPEPQWFRNLRAADRASFEIGDRTHDVTVEVVEGEERDLFWKQLLERGSFWQKYADRSGRVIPIGVLTRADVS